ncbi:uncharacterized protein JCM6883_004852 [Sporobolomyces salmoneus]|uniref:uncharacterized protein n=1 Tax=Sporobolomyces salmoneus TaxID=183962 RepID=UPI003172655F
MSTTVEPGPPALGDIKGRPSRPQSASHSSHEETLADNPPSKSVDQEEKGQESEKGSEQPGEKQAEQKKEEPPKDPFLVTLEGRDHLNPHTWPVWYRWFLTGFAGLLVLNATFASSAPSNLIPSIIAHYGVSQEVGVLTIAIFVAGYCVGPLLWGPLSERYGRRLIFLGVWVPYCGFVLGCALAPNIGAMLAFRFLSGCFASSPLTNSGGVIADLWDADRRGDALAIFSLMPFAGPALAPIISGFMEVQNVDFRWVFWTLLIFAGVCGIGIVFLLPETYVPYILHVEAKRLRKETGDDRWYSPMDKKQDESFKAIIHRTVLKPFIMLFQEPMLLVITLYMSFIYGIVYLLFEAIPIVFGQQHGLNAGKTGLIFLALLMGGVLAVVIYVLYFNKQYMKLHRAYNGRGVPPEQRLIPLFYSAPGLAIAFFWFAFTSYPSISVWSPIFAIALLGFCILYTFLAGFNYIIDTYLWAASSALAANTVVRSSFGAGFPMFAGQMYRRLGTQGASGLLGGLAIVFVPVPFVLYKYGRKIRSMSKNAVVLDK